MGGYLPNCCSYILKGGLMNQDHVRKLLEGVENFNEWRKLNPDVRPDLSNAKFANAQLYGADLNYANLQRFSLERTG